MALVDVFSGLQVATAEQSDVIQHVLDKEHAPIRLVSNICDALPERRPSRLPCSCECRGSSRNRLRFVELASHAFTTSNLQYNKHCSQFHTYGLQRCNMASTKRKADGGGTSRSRKVSIPRFFD